MKRDRLFTGLLLLGIGILFLLDNFKVINFHWINIVSLWPLFLIISGVNLIFNHYNSTTATTVKVLIFAAVFALVIYRGSMPPTNNFWGRNFNQHTFFDNDNNDSNDNNSDEDDSDDDDKSVVKLEGSRTYNEPYSAAVKTASLNIKGGGVTYVLQDTTNQLFSAVAHELSGKFHFNTTANDSNRTINFNSSNSQNSINWDSDDKGSQAEIRLNNNPVWNIDIASGASKMDLDLTKFKIRNLHVKGGATSMDLRLGQPIAGNTTVDIATGVSEVNIKVPANTACRIESKTGLSSKTFEGFDSKGNNQYETAGFAAAPKKIYLNLKGGISDFNVKRY